MITVETIMALRPCYTPEQVRKLVGDGIRPGAALAKLLALSPSDARWVLARLLPTARRVAWAKGCAERAKRYATYATYATTAATYATTAATYATTAADYAATAAATAADYAAYAADADAADDEHKMACVLGLELLCERGGK